LWEVDPDLDVTQLKKDPSRGGRPRKSGPKAEIEAVAESPWTPKGFGDPFAGTDATPYGKSPGRFSDFDKAFDASVDSSVAFEGSGRADRGIDSTQFNDIHTDVHSLPGLINQVVQAIQNIGAQ